MIRQRVFVMLVSTVLAVIGSVVPGVPASAAVHCDGNGCNGRKIGDTDCKNQAYAIAGMAVSPAGQVLGRGDLWFSPTCHAMWGDFNATSENFFGEIRLVTQPEYGGLNKTVFSETLHGVGNVTTTLIGWQQSVQLCGAGTCTAWR